MKPINRKNLECDEVLRFNKSNNFQIDRYFSTRNMNFENNTLNLCFNHSYAVIPDSIIVKAIYLDCAKKIDKYETIEFFKILEISLPKEGILKQNEISNSVLIKEDSKYLWKIFFKIKPKIVCDLHLSIS